MRNNHRDALRRQKILKPKSGSGAVNIKSWRFQENMAFLIPHMANRSTITNIEDNEPSPGSSNTIDIENNIQDNITDQELRDEELNQTLKPSTDPSADQGNKRKRHKRNTLNDLLSKSIEDHERRAANRQQERERLNANTTNDFTISNVKNDPLFHFFISMYETTKSLPPLSQHNIKTNIFSLVSQEEAKNLVQYSPRPHSTNSRNSDTRTYYSSYTPSPAEQPQEYLQTETSPIIITQGSELNTVYTTESTLFATNRQF